MDLVSQDTIARLVFKPSLFQEAGGRLKAFHDLEDLRSVSAMPSIKDRLKACAQVLDLRHGVQIYGAMMVFNDRPADLDTIRRSMSRSLGDRLSWSENLTTESLGELALSVRKTFDAYGEHLAAEQRHDLMQIAARLNEIADDLCDFAAEARTPVSARKLGAVAAVLYGSGIGNDRTELLIEGLSRLARKWEKMNVGEREARLGPLNESAKILLDAARAAHASLFDPIGTAAALPAIDLLGAYVDALPRHNP